MFLGRLGGQQLIATDLRESGSALHALLLEGTCGWVCKLRWLHQKLAFGAERLAGQALLEGVVVHWLGPHVLCLFRTL